MADSEKCEAERLVVKDVDGELCAVPFACFMCFYRSHRLQSIPTSHIFRASPVIRLFILGSGSGEF